MCTRMGAGMRQIYVDKFHLLPETLTSANTDVLYLRSTDVSRTRESLLSVLEGLYPANTRHSVYLPITVYRSSTDYISPNVAKCPRVYQLVMDNVNSSEWKSKYQSVKDVLDSINDIAGTKGDSTFDDGFSVIGWNEVFRARGCHSMPYPCTPDGKTCVTQEMVDAILEVGKWQAAHMYYGEELYRLVLAPIMDDILKSFDSRISTGKGPKYIHYSGHDSILFPLVAALNGDLDLPPYASSIRIELWQTSDSSYGVQMIYNNKALRPQECQSDTCPYDQFQNMIKSRLTIHDVRRECLMESDDVVKELSILKMTS